MTDNPDLQGAYALQTPEDSRKLYATWAATYDSDFADDMDYKSPAYVAQHYASLKIEGPVLDLGAGTGLVGTHLAQLGVSQIDGTDISPDMLAVAASKTCYRRLFEGDLTLTLPVADASYAGAVSAGTFTHGHVGPQALGEVLRILKHGGTAVLSINAAHWTSHGYAEVLDRLSPQIARISKRTFALYGPRATGPHAHDMGYLVTLIRN